MVRPLIGMSARPRNAGEVSGWPETDAAVMQRTYLNAVWRAGGIEALFAPRMVSDADADAMVARVDGLVLVGGGDVDPALYGAEPHEHVYGVFAESDSLELALARAAVKSAFRFSPFVGACRFSTLRSGGHSISTSRVVPVFSTTVNRALVLPSTM